ncbi:hypothetical protein [Paraburkholderia fynbosensis]|uniref:hypothetical protein n=1 Tax=Paraburkholderia fynbosensis TaxID=1200993 RepID=UPI001583BB2B|nr:hypothetical protein [Paraburkholderia fynbosensis]
MRAGDANLDHAERDDPLDASAAAHVELDPAMYARRRQETIRRGRAARRLTGAAA